MVSYGLTCEGATTAPLQKLTPFSDTFSSDEMIVIFCISLDLQEMITSVVNLLDYVQQKLSCLLGVSLL